MTKTPNFVLFVSFRGENFFPFGCGLAALDLCGEFPIIRIAVSPRVFRRMSFYLLALTRQTLSPESSATSREPSGATVTPTGRP
jgi:hypothetical protein